MREDSQTATRRVLDELGLKEEKVGLHRGGEEWGEVLDKEGLCGERDW